MIIESLRGNSRVYGPICLGNAGLNIFGFQLITETPILWRTKWVYIPQHFQQQNAFCQKHLLALKGLIFCRAQCVKYRSWELDRQ